MGRNIFITEVQQKKVEDFQTFKEVFDLYLQEAINEASEFLTPYGLEIRIDQNYGFGKKRWLAVYEYRSRMILKNKIVVGVNYPLFWSEMRKRGIDKNDTEVRAQAIVTVMHEVGHGLVDWLESFHGDVFEKYPQLKNNEEEVVEEFGESFIPDLSNVWDSRLRSVLEGMANNG